MPFDPASLPPPPKENDTLPAAHFSPDTLALLSQRRSLKLFFFGEPGPSPVELDALLHLAARVPDHGKLGPWRFVVIEGDARARVSEKLAGIVANDPGMTPERLEIERRRFLHAPVCVMIVSTAAPHPKIPEWEQVLSSGAAAFNLLISAHAMGYAGVWLTEWPAYDDRARGVLGLSGAERVAGFVHLGTATQPAIERVRADAATRISRL